MADDRIEKSAVLRAPLDRVWRAISDSAEFGTWFGMVIEGPFVPGVTVQCVMGETVVDDAVAAQQSEYAGERFPLHIVAVEPPRQFSFRWNPVPGQEYADLTTLVEFTLSEVDDGVLLEIVESGFDAVPEEHRATAFGNNDQGWAEQLRMVAGYVTAESRA
ncbi:SRPBCC family protein [Mycolicibacterium confluentis]|uniref:Activator of Hsp90 ATPase homologue 1/2-like C-terminal domain-containing protein n=1 Tax=Mycolicibacterium confluentis TaxID=28047 RepID=A0A7I7XYJ3_9MYCO|nr:SRPBCC family protein [Mycolicibacterium confluentis]MCV7321487.1 SRPBCC family protein [Mycolicibacterium confluentis]ORV30054.1 vanillate O-demethylase oxidoreductase VanB [Mycolicibacterium confluentis]BBZ34425.1 hypothetical protein MCNF_30300 [Mycolicibacterium confluentis]